MPRVKLRDGETTQQLVGRFKKMCLKEGLVKAIKEKERYVKPSDKRRSKKRRPPVEEVKRERT